MMNDGLPFVPLEVVEYLKDVYDVDYLLTTKVSSSEELVGYIKGVRTVIQSLDALSKRKESD